MIFALRSTLSLQKVFGAAAPPRRRAATPLRLFQLGLVHVPAF
jgi:hypothetical protein